MPTVLWDTWHEAATCLSERPWVRDNVRISLIFRIESLSAAISHSSPFVRRVMVAAVLGSMEPGRGQIRVREDLWRRIGMGPGRENQELVFPSPGFLVPFIEKPSSGQ
jgi:hypothetical protein